ncbi:hypothetical protein M3694_01430 [Kocuria marina]|uniref:hypothetical protein n=1 Tax=Kocuria marina TaxID=223184 RepID=UPI002989B7F6|nr:hypothetical protein [Kocuria marina]MCT2360430.1 hypothetical protein [Kocuria marina]
MRRITIPLTAAAAALALTGCGAFTPAPTATVTVTATPGTEAAAAPVETTPPAPAPTAGLTQDPAQATAPTPAPTYTPEVATPIVPAQPAATEDAATDLVSAQGMQGDDYVIYMSHDLTLTQAQAVAPNLLAAKLSELRGTPQAQNIDLVAVYGPDYELLTTDQVTPHPQCAGC